MNKWSANSIVYILTSRLPIGQLTNDYCETVNKIFKSSSSLMVPYFIIPLLNKPVSARFVYLYESYLETNSKNHWFKPDLFTCSEDFSIKVPNKTG